MSRALTQHVGVAMNLESERESKPRRSASRLLAGTAFDEAVPDGVARETGPVVNVQRLPETRLVLLDRVDGDVHNSAGIP